MTSQLVFFFAIFYRKYRCLLAKPLRISIAAVTVLQNGLSGAKICYQCDDLHPSGKWKFWGEKITRCSGIPLEKYATKTSRAFGAAVLTCYTVGLLISHGEDQTISVAVGPCRNSTNRVPSSNAERMAWVKHSTRTSSVETVITSVADRLSATSTRRHLAHRLVSTRASIERMNSDPYSRPIQLNQRRNKR
jgi:hypothetical protein